MKLTGLAGRKKILLFAIGAILFCFLAGYIGYGAASRVNGQGGTAGSGMRYTIDDTAVPLADLEDTSSPGGIKIPGYAVMRIPAETAEVSLPLTNPTGNPCYFTYEIILDETGESLYISDMIGPGTAIPRQTLTRTLPTGEYETSVNIKTYELETYDEMNGANLKSKLIVL